MKKILFIASHRLNRAPGQRFRFEQYFDFLKENGFEAHLSYLLDEDDDKVFYKEGYVFTKFLILRKGYMKRKNDLSQLKDYELVFVFREALMTRSTKFEQAISKSGIPMVFDFDDAIWLQNVSNANRWFAFAKNPNKTSQIIGMSTHVVAGNLYLADFALQFNSNVSIIPTTIDTEQYQRMEVAKSDQIVIGWSGSITTIQHFEFAVDFLKRIKNKYAEKVRIKVIGDGSYRNEQLGVQGVPWIEKDEVKELSEIDIGIMPLPDDEWAKGKCGLKGLQYMALEIPTIMSPVGVNSEIIEHGENGMLASTEAEWVSCIELLIESPTLRKKMGEAGRKTVVDQYSVEANKIKYLELFRSLTA